MTTSNVNISSALFRPTVSDAAMRIDDFDGDGVPNRYDRDHHDRDRDGVSNRYDRDRDGDGVPNRHDRRPDNPYRN